MHKSVLIASRGEAVIRVARTARRLGVETVGLRCDAGGLYQEACDRFVDVSSGELAAEELAAVAKAAEVDAVFPGYITDSQHRALARALEKEGIVAIGVDPDVAETLSDRGALAKLADVAGIPSLVLGVPSSIDEAREFAEGHYPVLFKSADARTGCGRFHAEDEGGLAAAYERALGGTRGGAVVLERDLKRCRDLEVMMAIDGEGAVLPLVDIETSVLQGSRGILRECPSPYLAFRGDGEAIRNMLYEYSRGLASQLAMIGLVSAQFLVDVRGRLFLRGARTGLPALHAPMEFVTQLDLVELMFQLSVGGSVPSEVRDLRVSGHSVGAQLLTTAENRSVPKIVRPTVPQRTHRIELSLAEGTEIAPDEYPRVGKLSTHAPVRHQACQLLDRTLAWMDVGIETNREVLRRVLGFEAFRAGQYDCTLVDRIEA